jgi:hypothetical protein
VNDGLVEADQGPEATPQHTALANVIRTLTESHAKETEVKKHELEVRSQEIAANERIAMKSIDAQERSHCDNRVQYNKHLIHRYVFILAGGAIIAGFTIAMMMNGGKDIILEIVKVTLAVATGAYGGFHAGKSKKAPDDE